MIDYKPFYFNMEKLQLINSSFKRCFEKAETFNHAKKTSDIDQKINDQ